MKYLSFKIIFISIFLPPLLYLATINRIEIISNNYFSNKIKNIYLEDSNAILNGSVTLKEAVNSSISKFLEKNPFIKLGIRLDIIVTTNDGIIIYPSLGLDMNESETRSPVEIARTNFRILQKGLNIDVKSNIRPFSFLATGILGCYLLFTLFLFFIYYRRATKKIGREYRKKEKEISRLRQLESDYADRVERISLERKSLQKEYEQLKESLEQQRKKAAKEEEEMFGEIEVLEKKLEKNLAAQEEQLLEIEELKEEIKRLEKLRSSTNRQKQKTAERISRRFKTLYKNISVSQRACAGFAGLDEDMALKAEEIIYQLNDDANVVPIKRKVFSKKSRKTVFEVVFAYRGRLYFQRMKNHKIEIVTIGTKNTQGKDLAYIDTL